MHWLCGRSTILIFIQLRGSRVKSVLRAFPRDSRRGTSLVSVWRHSSLIRSWGQ